MIRIAFPMIRNFRMGSWIRCTCLLRRCTSCFAAKHRMSSQSTLIQLWVCWHCAPSKCFITTRPYNGRITELCRPFVRLCLFVPRAGSGIVRIDPLRFLTGCRTRRLNQAMSVLSLSLDFYECLYCAVNYGPFLRCVILFVCVFCLLVVLVMLSVTVQVIDWKDSSTKWPIMCWYSLTHSLQHSSSCSDR